MSADLTEAMRARLDALVSADKVVVFMKGTRDAPNCQFSARVVEILDGLVDDYTTHNVLADAQLRESMKAYADWPTFPQLWVDGAFVGGADIVAQLHQSGELFNVVKHRGPLAPKITLTDAARDRIRGVVEGKDVPLRLRVDAHFRYQFEEVEGLGPGDVSVTTNGVRLVLDRASARRSDGMTMDFVSGPQGAGLVVTNPHEPARVQPLTPQMLAAWRAEGRVHHLLDVRTDEEWALARIEGARLLDEATDAWLATLPKDEPIVFQCHHGVRSQHAAQHFLGRGHRQVFNLSGGIDAWSTQVDAAVPRY